MLCVRPMPAENKDRISVEEYCSLRCHDHTLIDVRDRTQFEICHLPNSTNIPFSRFTDDAESALAWVSREKPVFVVCRFGNDSQLAVNAMKSLEQNFSNVKDLKGGLHAWAETFPTDIIPKY